MTQLLIGICLIVTLFNSMPCLAVESHELVDNAHLYDGKKVEYQGEVVGDIMRRGEFAWLNVNDGGRAIGVWAKGEQVEIIKKAGCYNYIGDKIKVIGTFHRSCPEHGGDLDIHAQEITLLKEGYPIEHTIYPAKIVVAMILLLALLAVIILPKILKVRP